MARLFICGDIVNEKPNYCFIGPQLINLISDADYSVCNFEGPELTKGEKASFPHQEPRTAAYLQSVGFDLMLLANNHITEQGKEGVEHSRAVIKAVGCDCIGAGLSWKETYQPLEKEIKGQHFGFINVCEAQVGQYLSMNQTHGYAWMGYDNLFTDVKELRKRNDNVVVFVHAGLEHYNIPLPEIRDLYKKLCDSGASAVIGSHPHCAQGWEHYKDSVIVYSLGNFFFPLRERWPNEASSYSVLLSFLESGKLELTPVFHTNNGKQVELAPQDSIGLDNLNERLGAGYEDAIKEVINKAYNHLCKNLLLQATCGQNEKDNIKRVIRKTIDYTIHRKENVLANSVQRNKLLLRLFENESYRWVIIRYLKQNTI